MRDGTVRSYGVVSARETIAEHLKKDLANRFNDEVLVPRNHRAGHISVTTKSRATPDELGGQVSEGLRADFIVVRQAEEVGHASAEPALAGLVPEMSTVELDYNRPLEGAEESFKFFIRTCLGLDEM